MKEGKELAAKVKNFLNVYTSWNFQIQQEGDSYVVGTSLENEQGQHMIVSYEIHNESVRLRVTAIDCKCTLEYIMEKVKSAGLQFKVNAVELGESVFALEKAMTSKVLDHRLFAIARDQMTAMMEIMTEIIHEKAV